MSTMALPNTDLPQIRWNPQPGGGSRIDETFLGGLAEGLLSLVAAPILDWPKIRSDDVTAPTTIAPDLDTSIVLSVYVPRDRLKVEQCLQEHPGLVSLLIDAIGPVREFFGNEVAVELQLIPDREGSGGDDLFAFVGTRLDADEAFRRLQAFDSSWWLDALPRADRLLTFSLDFDDV